MSQISRFQRARLSAIQLFQESGCSVSDVSRRYGFARSTFYRWYGRFLQGGLDDLVDRSSRPRSFGHQCITPAQERLVLELRKKRWGPQRIAMSLSRDHGIQLSKGSVWLILKKHNTRPLVRVKKAAEVKRYSAPLPGDRVQMDSMKIGAGKYQFTAIDDCTRIRVLRLYERRNRRSAIAFLYEVLDFMGFPIKVVQTDWGTEFFNEDFQQELHEHFIKFRPIKPRSPHLNGKVERSHLTDRAEFYSTVDAKDVDLAAKLAAWEHFYNTQRPHGAHGGRTPEEKLKSLQGSVPLLPDHDGFWNTQEMVLPRRAEAVYRHRLQESAVRCSGGV